MKYLELLNTYTKKDGYIYEYWLVKTEKDNILTRCIAQHRRVWEQHYGIKIPKGFHIHHIDGNKRNNKIHNLVCLYNCEHTKIFHSIQEKMC